MCCCVLLDLDQHFSTLYNVNIDNCKTELLFNNKDSGNWIEHWPVSNLTVRNLIILAVTGWLKMKILKLSYFIVKAVNGIETCI